MADVDLLVEVRDSGIERVIAELTRLKSTGKQTGSAMTGLAKATEESMRNISAAVSGATGKINDFKAAITQTGKGSISITAQLRELEKGYRKIGKLNPDSTAAQRLTLFGDGDLARGKEMVSLMERLRRTLNADPSRDRNEVLRQELELLRQKEERLRAIGQQENAKRSNQRAREDLANQANGISRVAQAELNLKRAIEDRARAEEARKKTGIGVANTQRTAALNAETAAIRAVINAERELVRAREEEARATAAATKAAHDHANAFQSSFSYFIIAGMAQQATQAILGVGTAAVLANRDIERSFADVDRTFDGSAAQLQSLRARLSELATETPVSFVDLSEIATLGNQLGITERDIQSFTTTIAQYTAVSGQSAEDAATAFGRISNLTGLAASEYSNLASAITYVARTTVATESTIQNTAKEITALASGAGFSADAIIGLAGALSSLAIPPERARGALSLYFGALNESVAEGGPKLAAFAQLTGKTTEELSRLVRENRGQEVFTAFIAGLSQLDSVAKTTALDTLGLSTIRVDQTMRALSQNVPLVTKSFDGAATAFAKNTEIATQYAKIQETLASKMTEFQNAVQLAAGAMGKALEPALIAVLDVITDVLANFTKFANNPIGAAVIQYAGVIAGLVLTIASLIGALALVRVGLVVIPWALTGLGATGASTAIGRFVAGLVGMNLAVVNGQVQLTRMNGILSATGATSWAATAGFTALKFAIAATGIGLAATAIGTLVASLISANEQTGLTADKITGLGDALAADTAEYLKSGYAIAKFKAESSDSASAQEEGAKASKAWATVLGKDLVDGANAASEAISQIVAGDQTVEAIRSALGEDADIKAITSDSKFAKTWSDLGLNMTELITQGIQGEDVSKTITDVLREAGIRGFMRSRGLNSDSPAEGASKYLDSNGNDVTSFVNGLRKIGNKISGTDTQIRGMINSTNVLGSGLESTGGAAGGLTDGFVGAKDSLTEFQSAVGTGLGKFVNFSDILGTIRDRAKEAADEQGDDSLLTSMVNAETFGAELKLANSDAADFYSKIAQLVATGSTTFATELASLGPEAAGILGSALDDPAGLAELEAGARFAAFLASDEFKNSLKQNMTDSNAAYARIFEVTGDFSQVQDYIAAQIAGTGAEWEKQWALNHPDFPLNVELMNPTPEDLEIWAKINSGRIVVQANVKPKFDFSGRGTAQATNTYIDSLTGASITLPASLDGSALSTSLSVWQEQQDSTPQQIAAELNKDGLSDSLDQWVAEHGPVVISAVVRPSLPGDILSGILSGILPRAKGGPIPAFATGGGYGVFRGPGSGTSDSILARVSNGEYINTADATRFWGPDFFDSLNKKMLPSSFVNMLGRAAVSGNSGPSHVTHVQLTQMYPTTRDPLKTLREDSEMVAAGVWG